MSGKTSASPKPRRVKHRRAAAAPTVDINIHPDDLDDLQREMGEFEDLRAILTFGGRYTYDDGKYGERTFLAILQIAKEAGIVQVDAAGKPVNPEVISEINFREKTGDLYTRWQKALQNHHKKDETPHQVVARVDSSAADKAAADKAAADKAAREAAERAAAEKAAREAEDAKIDPSVRGTAYDRRVLAKLDKTHLNAAVMDILFSRDEIASRGSKLSPETQEMKIRELQRRINKELDIPVAITGIADVDTAYYGRILTNRRNGVNELKAENLQGRSQAEKDYFAAKGLHGLDRTSGIKKDPENAIRDFQKDHSDKYGLAVTGVADDKTLAAIRSELLIRDRLTPVEIVYSQPTPAVSASAGQAVPPAGAQPSPAPVAAPSTLSPSLANVPPEVLAQADAVRTSRQSSTVQGGVPADEAASQRLPELPLVDRRRPLEIH
jgi:hypothetical protein